MLKRLRYSSSIFRRVEQVTRTLSRAAVYSIILALYLYAAWMAYSYFMIRYFIHIISTTFTLLFLRFYIYLSRQQSTSSIVNTHCKDNPNLEYCKFPEGKRWKKFVMLVTDCWPIKYAKDVFEHYQVLNTYTLLMEGQFNCLSCFYPWCKILTCDLYSLHDWTTSN